MTAAFLSYQLFRRQNKQHCRDNTTKSFLVLGKIDLHKLATKAHPNVITMSEGSFRESFISLTSMNDTYIASRLRELQNLDMEELLDFPIMFHGCQTDSAKPLQNIMRDINSIVQGDQHFDLEMKKSKIENMTTWSDSINDVLMKESSTCG